MDKHEVAQVLREIALLLELEEDNPFKSRAYYNGARAIELLQEDLETLVREKRLAGVAGIGKALSEKIGELVQNGRLTYYEELKARVPAGVLTLFNIPGLGPKKIRLLYKQLGITNLRELEYAIKENRLLTLPGFGGVTQNKIMAALEYLKTQQGFSYYAEALGQGLELLEELQEHPAVEKASLAGSLRRGNEVVRNIDLLAAGENPREISEYFLHLTGVSEVLSHAETEAAVRLKTGLLADLRVVDPSSFAGALYYYTGSREHTYAVRKLAEEKGYRLTPRGLFREASQVPCGSEKELLGLLGLDYIPPELRENKGEIEAAGRGKLPQLVEYGDIQGVFHIHTSYSDGLNTLEEMVEEAIRLNFSYLGISDHSQSAFYARGLKVEDIKRQLAEIAVLRERYPGIAIFSGIESDIKADGSLDYDDEVLAAFDFVIASVHSHFSMPEQEMTKRIIKAMSHHAVTMLGHPTGRLLLARKGYRVNVDSLLAAAREYSVIIELNASPARLDLDWRHLKKAQEMGILISISPDAHRVREIEDVYYGVAAARKGWLEQKDVFNCLTAAEVTEYLTKRKGTKGIR